MVPHLKIIVIFGIFPSSFSIRMFFQKKSRRTDAWLDPSPGSDESGTKVEARLETY
jgi:hypothetical protein